MSSTKSPIPSELTNTGTDNTSTAQRSWWHSFYFQRIQSWPGIEIEFQCYLARFVISNKMELRGQLTANQNGFWNAILWIWGEKRCATRKGAVTDVQCRVGKRSDDGDRGVRNEIGGHRSRPRSADPAEQPIHAEHHQKGREVQSVEWNREASNWGRGQDSRVSIHEEEHWQQTQNGALNEILQCQFIQRSADADRGAPIIAEQHHWGGRGGVVWSSQLCVIDECSGFCSNTIYHCGMENFTLIFILRKHNCKLLSNGILRQCTINNSSQKS